MHFLSVQNYLTDADLSILRGDSNEMAKLQYMVDRGYSLGLELLTEKSTQHVVAVLHCVVQQGMCSRPTPGFSSVMEFKRLLKQRIKTHGSIQCGIPYVANFPTHPEELPKQFYEIL
jgi:hypothetical protein